MRVLLTTVSTLALFAAPALALAANPPPPGAGTTGATTSHSTLSQSATNPSAAPSTNAMSGQTGAMGTSATGPQASTSKGVTATPPGSSSNTASKADQTFVKQASAGNLAEVQAGKLAAQKSHDPAVQEFGRWMETDHMMAEELLKASVKSADVQMPTSPNAVQQREIDGLKKLSGTQFDQKYINGQVTAHEKTIKLFQNEAKSGQDTTLKTYAKGMLPALNAHLQEAQALQANMSNQTASGAAGTAATSNAAVGSAAPQHPNGAASNAAVGSPTSQHPNKTQKP